MTFAYLASTKEEVEVEEVGEGRVEELMLASWSRKE